MNVAFSLCLAMLPMEGFKPFGFPISYMSVGYIISIGYYELSKKNQYYFYFNKGLSRMRLFLFGFAANSVVGLFLILIIRIWQIC